MNTRTVLLGAIAALTVPVVTQAANIDRATLTEVVNRVSVIEPASKKTSTAKVQQLFVAPNVLRTGPDSRAEMVAPDQTVTRVGQNTLFSFEPNSREIDLQRGSILFQSPSGQGGGTIRTPAASAAVLGTTLIVTTTQNGGFKVLLVEGRGRVKGSDGALRRLSAGQMVYALPGGKLSNTFEFRLSQQVGAARLLSGFKKPLPSAAKIQAAVNKQEKEIAQGKAIATNLLATNSPDTAIQVDVALQTLIKEETVADSNLANAATTDAIILAPTLESTRLFTPESMAADVPTSPAFFPRLGDSALLVEEAARPAFFVGSNIRFDTSSVDLSLFADRDLFQFLAVNNINFAQSVDLGLFGGQELQFIAGGGFENAPGTIVAANTGRMVFAGFGSALTNQPLDGPEDIGFDVPFKLTDFGVANLGGGLDFIGGDMTLTGVQLGATQEIGFVAARDLVIEGAADNAILKAAPSPFSNGAPSVPSNFSTVNAGSAILIAAKRDLRIERTSFNSPRTLMEAGRRLRLTSVQINDGQAQRSSGSPSGPPQLTAPSPITTYLFARDLVDLRGVNFFANDVLVQSNTVSLQNVNFRGGSRVILESAQGRLASNPNTNAPVQPGFVNFVSNVRYNGTPAEQGAVIQNGPGPTPSGNGIIVRPFTGRPKN